MTRWLATSTKAHTQPYMFISYIDCIFNFKFSIITEANNFLIAVENNNTYTHTHIQARVHTTTSEYIRSYNQITAIIAIVITDGRQTGVW